MTSSDRIARRASVGATTIVLIGFLGLASAGSVLAKPAFPRSAAPVPKPRLLLNTNGTTASNSTRIFHVPVSARVCAGIKQIYRKGQCDSEVVVRSHHAVRIPNDLAGLSATGVGWHWTNAYASVEECSPFPTYCSGWHMVLAESAGEGEYGYGPYAPDAGRVCNHYEDVGNILALGVSISVNGDGIIDNCKSPMNPWENATVSLFFKGFPISDEYELRLYMYANGTYTSKVYNSA
jgi:hypothetical protein